MGAIDPIFQKNSMAASRCGFEIGRDVNAAINTKNEAISNLRAAGTTVLKPVELLGYRS